MTEKVTMFKLSSGEEIIGKFVNTSEGVVQLRSVLRADRISDGVNVYYTLKPWFVQQFEDYEEHVIGILAEHIVAQFMPGQNVIKQYHSSVEYQLSPSEEPEDMSDSDGEGNEIEWPEFPGGSKYRN